MTTPDQTPMESPGDDQRDPAAPEWLSGQFAGLRPVQPGPDLRARVAAELAQPAPGVAMAAPRGGHRRLGAVGERLAWAAGGAAVASLAFLLAGAAPVGREPVAVATVATVEPAASRSARVSEEAVGWSDEGIRFVDEFTPARILRRQVIERHSAGDGTAEVRVPREDVIFLPVALR
jgi:hypothetical protein